MIDLKNGWKLLAERGTDWIFFRLTSDEAHPGGDPALAEAIVAEAAAAGMNRVVFELDDKLLFVSYLVGQVVSLHKRFVMQGGAFRICGFSAVNYDVLRTLHMADRLPNYPDREAAVNGRLA